MTELPLLFGCVIMVAMVTVMAFKAGWEGHKMKATPITIQSIESYIAQVFPDKWAAYKQGVHEGYEQGLRDGQEMPDELA